MRDAEAVRARPADFADARAFAEVVAEVAAEGRWIVTEAPVDVEEFGRRVLATIKHGDDRLWVLEDAGEVVGCLGLHATRVPGVLVVGMSVRAGWRGRGGGRMLLRAAIAHARAIDVAKVELEVFPWNARAIALYASAGFQVEGLRRAHYPRKDGTRWPALLMAWLNPGEDTVSRE